MQERFALRMSEPRVRSDARLLADFTGIYCRGRHKGADRTPLVSDAVVLGVYGRRVPVVCEECSDLLRYSEQRRASCPKDPKPFCSDCDTHCYRQGMRDRMREVMRYAGPRSMFTRHALTGVQHLIQGRTARNLARQTAATESEKES